MCKKNKKTKEGGKGNNFNFNFNIYQLKGGLKK